MAEGIRGVGKLRWGWQDWDKGVQAILLDLRKP
jgi:hypothetical protein